MITGVDVYPANQKESTIVLRHLEKQISGECTSYVVLLWTKDMMQGLFIAGFRIALASKDGSLSVRVFECY